MSEFSLTEINDKISQTSAFVDELKKTMNQIIVGQDELINKLLIGIVFTVSARSIEFLNVIIPLTEI